MAKFKHYNCLLSSLYIMHDCMKTKQLNAYRYIMLLMLWQTGDTRVSIMDTRMFFEYKQQRYIGQRQCF